VARTAPKVGFETTFRVRGKVVESVMCDCEEEGHVGIRVARQMDRGAWDYSAEDSDSYFDVIAYSSDSAYLRLRPGDWVEADVTVRGQLSRVPTGEVDRQGISDGHRYEGRVSKAGTSVEIDFGTFTAVLRTSEATRQTSEAGGLRRGNYVDAECTVEASVIRHGSREEILGHSRRVFPRRGHA